MPCHRLLRHHATLLTFAALSAVLAAQGTPIGFPETYALAPDRSKAVATLIPGSEDWYYYSCLERLDARDFDSVRKILANWADRYGRGNRFQEIENREALLSFAADPQRTYDFLRHRLGAAWNHERVVPGERSNLPTQLDPAQISTKTLTARALNNHRGTVDGFTDHALAALLATNLDESQLRSLLSRLHRPDVDNLSAMIVRDLTARNSGGFGSHPIHRELRREQLDECVRLRPQLLQDANFVNAYLDRLQPSADVAWLKDPAARATQFARLWQFVQRLSPAFNSLRGHVLFHWLQHDLSQGAPDKDRFLAYIRLPRRSGYVAEKLRSHPRGEEFVDASTNYPTSMPAIGDDAALLRACLEFYFAKEDAIEPYADYVDANWLKSVLAETKILLGQGDMERWYTLLGNRSYLEQLEKRVELAFPATQRVAYAAGDRVSLEVDTKNVPTLLVRVFAIDSFRCHTEKQKEVDATIELDGVVANSEQTFTYAEPPLRRVRRTFDLPMLAEPGTYVVEFVGNGISSRAMIHKGNLRHVERASAAGQLFRIFDEAGAPQPTATVWFGGREYAADQDGEILLPFSTSPGQKRVVLRQGNRSSLATFEHRAESYTLQGNVHVDREALVAGQTAKLILRPQLRLAGRDVAMALLTDPVLTIVATDLDGTATPQELRGLQLLDDRELIHEIAVPERLQSLQVTLRGRVRDLAGKDVELTTASATFACNGIDPTPATSGIMLVRNTAGYALEMRGKNGELRPGVTLALRLAHRDYRDPIDVTLQTDATGRIHLGPLPSIDSLSVRHSSFAGAFTLQPPTCALPATLHGRAGETLRIPYQGKATSVSRAEFSLLGHESDAFAHLKLKDGFLELDDLPAGDYRLLLHETATEIRVRVTNGIRQGSWLLGTDRYLAATSTIPLHVRSLEIANGELLVRLANHSKSTRVHIAATRFVPAFDMFAHLRGASPAPANVVEVERAESTYHAGRTLGDEYRYVLERRFQTKYAGNMLHRPSLLVNPWTDETESWNTAVGLGGGAGGRYGDRSSRRAARPEGTATDPGMTTLADLGTFSNLDYLQRGAAVLGNLVPGDDGVLRVKLADLGPGHLVHVLAIDRDQAVQETAVREEQSLQPRARQLQVALDGKQHFVQQKRIEFVAAGGEAVLGDARAAEVEIYDSLASVHRLLTAVSQDASFAKFAFVLQWPKLTPAERQELYSQHACHELHFFLYHKDRAFFDAVCKPLLANKHDKTFLDHWLLGDDLRGFLEPWAFAQRNLIEKILLAQRLDEAEREAVARLVREGLELRPIDRERLDKLFDLALLSDSLAGKEQTEVLELDALKAGLPVNAPPPATVSVATTVAPAEQNRNRAENDSAKPEAAAPGSDESKRQRSDSKEKLAEVDATEAPAEETVAAYKERGKDLERRGFARQLFRAVEPTRLLVEHDYWRRRIDQTTPDIVAPNHFWVDYASAKAGQPFASTAIVETGGSFLEMMMAFAVMDLPFEAGKHTVVADGDKRTLRAATPLLLVRKEVQKTEKAVDLPPLLLGENLYRLDDRFRFENGERRDAFVTEEFLVDVAYGCQVVVTNPTSQKRVADLLLQIPAGAIPVQKSFWTKGVGVELQPYATATIEYAFYFPAAGQFAHYPAHAAEKGRLAAHAEPRTLRVVVTPTKIDTTSWEHVSQQGSPVEVMSFLDTHNLQQLQLDKIAWRSKDREFFAALLQKLRARHVYDHTIWSYGLLHRDAEATREYLRQCDDFLKGCGIALVSPLVTIDPVERKAYQHLELDPLVHQRAHQLGGERKLGNQDLARQYGSLLTMLGQTPRLGGEDWLAVTYYLLLQDRIEEAIAAFAKVDATALHEKLQHDYLSAYLCFFTGDTGKARSVATRYREYPVTHWQKRFAEVLAHVDEAEGKTAIATGEPNADAQAATAPAIELSLEGKNLTVRHKNLRQCEVRYYALDVEFAFSAMPFAGQGGTTAAFVQPNLRESRDLATTQGELTFPLPEQFQQQNVLVEVRGGGLSRSQTYFANALAVRFLESYGQVAVTEPGTNKPLAKTYVKVFAKLPSGQVRFHKDGYTDLRGRFDYASVSDDPNAGASQYAVLVLHEQKGAVIREVAPPTK